MSPMPQQGNTAGDPSLDKQPNNESQAEAPASVSEEKPEAPEIHMQNPSAIQPQAQPEKAPEAAAPVSATPEAAPPSPEAPPVTPEAPPAPEKPVTPEEAKPEKIEPVPEAPPAEKKIEEVPPPTAAPAKPTSLQEVEEVLAEDLEDEYVKMTPKQQKKFKQEGEVTAIKINTLLQKTKTKVKKIIDLIRKWLQLIPGVNKFFIEQEAKIKADKLMDMKDKTTDS